MITCSYPTWALFFVSNRTVLSRVQSQDLIAVMLRRKQLVLVLAAVAGEDQIDSEHVWDATRFFMISITSCAG